MIRFNRINMLKFFLVTATVLIGFNFILKSGERARNDDLFLPNLGDVDLNRLPVDLYEGKQAEESIDGHPKLKLKLVENVKEKIEETKKTEILVDEKSNNNIVDNENKLSSSSSKYILDISKERINKLFDILHDKEKLFSGVFKSLGLIVFDNLISGNDEPALKDFSKEKERFLKVVDNRVTVTDEFVSYLHNLSDYYSFEHPRNTVRRSKLSRDQNRPVFVTAANSNYYMPLQATIYQLHRYLPGYDIIVYDLGLTEEQYNMTVSNCKCKVVKFDQYYGKVSEHVKDLKTYAWKPILIQETLKTHPSVFYMDSSIRISTDEIGSQLSTLRETGLLTQFIALKLNCYTNPLMFKWFDEKEKSFNDFFTIEANILLFERTFLSSLLMKAWVTCALERDCIAPPGSNIGGCCGCHRFDQDAITIVSSFFYGHPRDANSKLPAYSFTAPESYFFSVRRYEGKAYFTQKP